VEYPDTLVLSEDTGYRRDYDRDPYQGYDTSERLMFDVNAKSRRYQAKEKVLGVERGKLFKAYPFSELEKIKSPVRDSLGDASFLIFYDSQSKTAVMRDEANRELPSTVGYWFAWYAFHPDTQVFSVKKE
jgi:hypothetical protein